MVFGTFGKGTLPTSRGRRRPEQKESEVNFLPIGSGSVGPCKNDKIIEKDITSVSSALSIALISVPRIENHSDSNLLPILSKSILGSVPSACLVHYVPSPRHEAI